MTTNRDKGEHSWNPPPPPQPPSRRYIREDFGKRKNHSCCKSEGCCEETEKVSPWPDIIIGFLGILIFLIGLYVVIQR